MNAAALAPATEADAAELVALRRAILAEGRWFQTEPDELREGARERAALLRQGRFAGNQVHLVARLAGELVGALSIEGGSLRRTRHVGRLELMVGAGVRGRGVGRALLERGLSLVRRNPVLRKVELAVYAHNGRALDLYVRAGFVEEGRRRAHGLLRDGTWVDEVWMAWWPEGAPPSSAGG